MYFGLKAKEKQYPLRKECGQGKILDWSIESCITQLICITRFLYPSLGQVEVPFYPQHQVYILFSFLISIDTK